MTRFLIYTVFLLATVYVGAKLFIVNLPKEDGEVAATVLPYDAKAAEIPFQTATFGLG